MSEEEKRRWKPPASAAGASGGRGLAERAHKVKRASSKEWVERQLNDPYVRRAKEEGWRSRAAFKLIELDKRFGLLRPGMRVCDLGAAPGGWLQYAAMSGAGPIVGIDLLPVEPLAGVTLFEMDFLDEQAPQLLLDALGGPPDIVLSDMAANTTGHRATDQIKTGALAEAAARFAMDVLAPGGAFVTKAFQGGLETVLLADLKRAFTRVSHAKPPASRAGSPEIFVVATGLKTTGRARAIPTSA